MTPASEQLLPWSNAELETLLRDLIAHGAETPKADCKAEIETGTSEGKADLLKDITAIANTYGVEYDDYGFLIYGVTRKEIIGVEATQADTDKLQSHVEELLKSYVAPMPQIFVIGFTTDEDKKWGVIVIPPRNAKPYMFVKAIQCADTRRSRKRGEWFVRRGSTTDVGVPEDLALISQRQMELVLEPLRESARSLQLRIAKMEEQYNGAIFSLMERIASGLPGTPKEATGGRSELDNDIGNALGADLPSRLRRRLRKPADVLARDLVAEAMRVREFVEGADTELPWAPQPIPGDAEQNKMSIQALEEKTRPLLISIATILLDDGEATFSDALLRVVRTLARSGAPTGVTYNQIGPALRDYPLVLLLYAAFICGTHAKRGAILKQIINVPLRPRAGDRRTHMLDVFSYVRRAKALFNTALGGSWCEPIALRIRQVISDSLGELFPGVPDDEYFFRGEFVLALTRIDLGITEKTTEARITPVPGLYLYMTEANEAIRELLPERPDWLATLYVNPLTDILAIFDRRAQNAVSFDCMGTGIYGLSTSDLYRVGE